MKLLTTLIFLITAGSVWAQTGKVTKVKGGKAIVDFGSQSVREGQTVQIGSGSTSMASSGEMQARQHGLNYSFLYQTVKPSSGSEAKETALEVDYGYNMGTLEIGPIFRLSMTEIAGFKSNSTAFGGFVQYNFVENKPGVDLIPYAKIAILFSSDDQTKTSSTTILGSGGILYFPFSQIFALNASLALGSQESKNSSSSTSSSIMSLQAGWRIYF